jgi:hypothetical protein
LVITAAGERRTHQAMRPAPRRALAVLLGAHGVAHLAGTADVFSRASERRSADYLAGGWTLSDPTTLRAFGVVWAVLAVAFAGAAVLTWTGRPGWPRVLWWVALASLAVVVVALWSSVIGVVIDLALLVLAWRAGALARPGTAA